MTQHYSKISNILKISRKIYNKTNYESSFTTKYLVNNYSNSYLTPKATVLKNCYPYTGENSLSSYQKNVENRAIIEN